MKEVVRRILGASVGAGALVALGCQPPPVIHGEVPAPRFGNVEGAAYQFGVSVLVDGPYSGEPSLDAWTSSGLQYWMADGQMKSICGLPTHVRAKDGERLGAWLIVFKHVEGKGPSGRGNYLLDVPDERIESARAGLLTMYWEPYETNIGKRYTAWLVVMGGPGGSRPHCEISAGNALLKPVRGPSEKQKKCDQLLEHADTLISHELNEHFNAMAQMSPAERDTYVQSHGSLAATARKEVDQHSFAHRHETVTALLDPIVREYRRCATMNETVLDCRLRADNFEALQACTK